MPQGPQTVHSETTLDLPWLRPLDEEMESVGFPGVHAHVTAPTGANIFLDTEQQKARILHPDGSVQGWHRNGKFRYDPSDRSWDMTWLELGSTPRAQLTLKPMEEDCGDEVVLATGYEFEVDGMEGREAAYFPQFVALVRDPLFNPGGFPLQSGTYKSEMTSICFDLDFGENPSLKPVADTLPAPLDFPYRTSILALEDIALPDGKTLPPGYYQTRVGSFNIYSGAALSIAITHGFTSYQASGDDLVRLIHAGKIEIVEILEDNRPNF